jgi:two-component system invasion response regulator UvrY
MAISSRSASVAALPVLMLSTYPDRQYAVRSLKLGAAGYLNKSADSEQMIEAIRRGWPVRPGDRPDTGRSASP